MISLIEDKKYKNLYRLQWPDGTVSVSTPNPDKVDGHYGFYNKTWATEHMRLREGKRTTVGRTYNSPWARFKGRGDV